MTTAAKRQGPSAAQVMPGPALPPPPQRAMERPPDSYFLTQLDRNRAKSDWVAFAIGLVANAAILHRAYPSATRDLVVHFVCFCTAMVTLLAWSLLGRRSYTRWRQVVHIAIRIDSIFAGCRSAAWRQFINEPPSMRPGCGTAVLRNAATFWAGLLGQSYVGVLSLLALAHPLPLYLHLPLQLASLGWVARQNHVLCASALLDNEVSRGLIQSVYVWLRLLLLGLPLPAWPGAAPTYYVQCRHVTTMLQVCLGLVLPTLLLCNAEKQALAKHRQQQQQQQGAARQRSSDAARPAAAGVGVGGSYGSSSGGGGTDCAAPAGGGWVLKWYSELLEWLHALQLQCLRMPGVTWLMAAMLWAVITVAVR